MSTPASKKYLSTTLREPYGDGLHVFVIDVETTQKNKGAMAVGSFPASPHHPDNTVVLYGYGVLGGISDTLRIRVEDGKVLFVADAVYVGHNVKFDLLYCMGSWSKQDKDVSTALRTIKLWDTMIVEYLLSGQIEKMPSLDTLCKKYKLPLKNEKIKAYWDNGIDTEDIPRDELQEYLITDINNTYEVYRQQYVKVVKMGMLPLVESQMELLLSTVVMEYNGIHVDVPTFVKNMDEVLHEVNALEEKLRSILPDVDPNSPKQLAQHLYGGERTVIVEEDVLDKDGNPYYFKSGIKKGLKKTRKVSKKEMQKGVLSKSVQAELSELSTSEEVLKEILNLPSLYTYIREYIKLLLEYREKNKEYTTYYVGVGNYIWNHDDYIHGSLNMGITATGRLSSSNPNLQNMPGYSDE